MAARIQSRAMLSSLSRSSGVSACAASCTQSRAKASNSFEAEPDDMSCASQGARTPNNSIEFPGSSIEIRAADLANSERLWPLPWCGRASQTSGVAGGYAPLIDGEKISTSRSCIAAAIHSLASAEKLISNFRLVGQSSPAARIRARKPCTPRRPPWRHSCEGRRRRVRLSLSHRRA